MRQNIERDLRRLVAPPAPAALRARCLATLPEHARSNAACSRPLSDNTLWKARRFALAGGLLAATAIGSAFWTTRPISNSTQPVSSSVAFAQTVEAMRNIEHFHMSGRIRDTEKGGWQSNDWWQTESWIDVARGAYSTSTNCPYASSLLPARFATKIDCLGLPDGTVYEKGNSQVVVEKNAQDWQKLKQQIGTELLGDLATTPAAANQSRFFNTGGKLQLKLTQTDSWQDREVNLFTFEGKPSSDNSKAPTILKKVYVDKTTNRVIAAQEFAILPSAKPQLMSQTEVDYNQPDPTLFDPIKFEQGTTRVSKEAPFVHP